MKTFQVNKDFVAFKVMDDEAVIIHTGTSDYFGLNLTGTYLWNLMIERDCHKDELVQNISRRYEQEPERIEQDVNSFLEKLTEAELILVQSHGHVSEQIAPSPSTITELNPYEPPDLVKFGDLETLILSGE